MNIRKAGTSIVSAFFVCYGSHRNEPKYLYYFFLVLGLSSVVRSLATLP